MMTYFVCIAIPTTIAPKVPSMFDAMCRFSDATETLVGKATIGKPRYPWKQPWTALFIEVGLGSASLICRGVQRKTHNNDYTPLMASGIQALLAMDACPYVPFLIHWFHGYMETEEITIVREERIELSRINAPLFYELEEDTRYTMFREDAKTPFHW